MSIDSSVVSLCVNEIVEYRARVVYVTEGSGAANEPGVEQNGGEWREWESVLLRVLLADLPQSALQGVSLHWIHGESTSPNPAAQWGIDFRGLAHASQEAVGYGALRLRVRVAGTSIVFMCLVMLLAWCMF